jgi:hypothetical protein
MRRERGRCYDVVEPCVLEAAHGHVRREHMLLHMCLPVLAVEDVLVIEAALGPFEMAQPPHALGVHDRVLGGGLVSSSSLDGRNEPRLCRSGAPHTHIHGVSHVGLRS